MMDKAAVMDLVRRFRSGFETEKVFIPQALDFLDRHENFWQRETAEGHLTGSAWILSEDRKSALLLHHTKLDRWLQPGGHAEMADHSLADTALREAIEECGLHTLQLLSPEIFDLDIHPIPARGPEPAHLHYDLRFLFSTPDRENVKRNLLETTAMAWWPLPELCQKNWPESIRRMALKSLNMERSEESF